MRAGHLAAATRDLLEIPELLRVLEARYDELSEAPATPIRMLYGDGDTVLVPRVHGDGLRARIPGATLTRLPAGHMLPLTHPAQCAALIRDCSSATSR